LFGEGNPAAAAWKCKIVAIGLEQGSPVLLNRLGDCLEITAESEKQQALKDGRDYDIGSGPTESFCGRPTINLKGLKCRRIKAKPRP
jgi:hypothetical protein